MAIPLQQPKPKPHEEIPTLEVMLALVQQGSIRDAKFLADAFQLNYQHPILIEAGISKGLLTTEAWLKKFVTVHPKMIELKRQTRILAPLHDTVYIKGESGTGKELLARALIGDRRGKFIALNCAGMPEHLIESELFGHVAGAFTDARTAKAGLMREAQDGLLFLDEIGDLNIKVQAKFLRALQEKTVRPVGSNTELPINCRIVCASHWNLSELVKQNLFRLDLYARLSTFELETLPLKDRPCDIMPIIRNMSDYSDSVEKAFLPIAAKLSCPLNVRSLEQYVRRFVVLGLLPTGIDIQ